MKASITQRALELGFDACRFTTVDPPHNAPQFQLWLDARRHGEMNYLQRNAHKRVDPKQVLAGAQSIICLAASYEDFKSHVSGSGLDSSVVSGPLSLVNEATGAPRNPPVLRSGAASAGRQSEGAGHGGAFVVSSTTAEGGQPATRPSSIAAPLGPDGRAKVPGMGEPSALAVLLRRADNPQPSGAIARYARFEDYHIVLGERLKLLAEFVNRLGGAGTRSFWYVDTGPLLERDLAQRAGLGFVGKHTNLISRGLGNWIFLAEIITTLELEPDAPEKNRCGGCTRCLDACPTRAITGPFQLDARLCISYLTIELKGPIPGELRPAIGNRIYGCDDCLAVCPWNRFAREGKLMQEHARPDLVQPDLIGLLSLDDAGFKQKFAGTPIVRTKRRGFLRNVCVALGNVGDAQALPALQRAANDKEPLIAEHARWAMQQILSSRRKDDNKTKSAVSTQHLFPLPATKEQGEGKSL